MSEIDNHPLPPYTDKGFDFGDDLLMEIIRLVQKSPVTPIRKVRALLRAGKVGEMYMGITSGDDMLERAFNSCVPESVSLARE